MPESRRSWSVEPEPPVPAEPGFRNPEPQIKLWALAVDLLFRGLGALTLGVDLESRRGVVVRAVVEFP